MVLLVEGKQISAELLSNPEHVHMLLKSNMALVMAANQLKSKAVEKYSSKSAGLLYLHQREMAVVSAQDPCVQVVGSDGAASCLLIVLRRLSTGDASMCKFDGGCEAAAFVKTSIEKMLQRVPQSVSPAQFEVHMVGGFQDLWLDSMWMTGELLLALQLSPFEFQLRTACVAHMNSRVAEDASTRPVIYGAAYSVRTAQLRPAEFEDRGPLAALRGARFLSSQKVVAAVYESASQQLVIEPFSYRQPPTGGLSLDFLIGLPDDRLVRWFSPCPGQERTAACARQLRATLRFIKEHRVPLVDVEVFGKGGIVVHLRPVGGPEAGGGGGGGGGCSSGAGGAEVGAGGSLVGDTKV